MKKVPKVLTRMRLSCCWGDNLDEKELNDVVGYINELERQCKKQKEVIDKASELIRFIAFNSERPLTITELNKVYNILQGVDNE